MRVSSPATVSISVVSGPTSQRAPIRVAPRRNVPGSTIVSRADLDPDLDQRAGRVDDRDARERVRAVDPLLGEPPHLRELDARVDAERQRRVGDHVRADRLALGAQQRQHVGQVELALRVVGAQLLQRLEQVAARERVDAGVDLADRLLLGRRVAGRLGLHHPLDAALRVAHDAPVAARVLELHRRHRGRRAALLVGARERGDRLGGDQRHVAVEHEHGGVGVDLVRRRADGVAGAVGLLLDRHLDVLGQRLGERALRPVDDHDPAGARLAGRGDRPLDHRAPAQRMQHLRHRRAHPGPLARGEDQDGGSGHRGIVVSALALGGRLMASTGFWCRVSGFESLPPSSAFRPIAMRTLFVSTRRPRYSRRPRRAQRRRRVSFADALRRLGMRPAGGNHADAARSTCGYGASRPRTSTRTRHGLAARHGRPLERARRRIELQPRVAEGAPVLEGSRSGRELGGQGEQWHGRRMALILDHINGVATDNRLENLQIVCPNCAATLDTHCGRNILPARDAPCAGAVPADDP